MANQGCGSFIVAWYMMKLCLKLPKSTQYRHFDWFLPFWGKFGKTKIWKKINFLKRCIFFNFSIIWGIYFHTSCFFPTFLPPFTSKNWHIFHHFAHFRPFLTHWVQKNINISLDPEYCTPLWYNKLTNI